MTDASSTPSGSHFNYMRWAALLVLVLLMVAVGRHHPPVQNEEVEPEKSRPAASVVGNYLSSRFAEMHGDAATASRYLGQALRADPTNTRLQEESYRIHLLNGEVGHAGRVAALMVSEAVKPSQPPAVAPEIVLALLRAYEEDYATAIKILSKGEDFGFNAVFLPLMQMWLAYGEGEKITPEDIRKAEKDAGNFGPFIYYHLALLCDLQGEKKLAETYYDLAASEPDKMPFRVVQVLGNYYQRDGRPEKARALYKAYQTANPDSYLISQSLEDAGDAKVAPVVGTVKEGLSEVFFSMGSVLFGLNAFDDAIIHLRLALFLTPKLAPAQLMLANVMEQYEQYDDAIALYDGMEKGSPYFHKGQIRKAYDYEMLGQTDKSLALLDDMIKTLPDHYDALLTRADILRNKERFAEAAEEYSRAIALLKNPEGRHWPVYYARGICFERTDRWSQAEADFKKALALEPGQPDVLNYLGYSWLVMGKNIAEAKKMIEEAIAVRPRDAHIIDSMGWALYSIGQFDTAISYLEQAIMLDAHDPTVNEHLGDAYFRLGRKLEARFMWERAITYEPEPKQAETIRKKLAQGMDEFALPAGMRAEDKPLSATAASETPEKQIRQQ